MVSSVIWFAIPTFMFAIVIMWMSIGSMLEKKSIRNFLPFFFLSLVLSFYGGAFVFEVFYDVIWMALEFSVFFSLVWILVDIWREAW